MPNKPTTMGLATIATALALAGCNVTNPEGDSAIVTGCIMSNDEAGHTILHGTVSVHNGDTDNPHGYTMRVTVSTPRNNYPQSIRIATPTEVPPGEELNVDFSQQIGGPTVTRYVCSTSHLTRN
jgi:hypothetical protein